MEISSDSGSGETRKPWATGGKECRGRCQCPGNYGRSSDLSQGLGARGASSGLPRTAVPREMRISSGRGEQIKQSTRRCSSWSKAKNKTKKIRTWRRSRINDACHAPTSLKVCHGSKVRHPSANQSLALTVYDLFWLTPPTRPRSSLSHFTSRGLFPSVLCR